MIMSNVNLRPLTANEAIAREVSGIENDNIFFQADPRSLDEMVDQREREKWNDRIDEVNKNFKDHVGKLQQAADEFARDVNHVEIKPIANYILVHPYTENPFLKVKVTESGIIYDLGGKRPEFKSNETGDIEECEQYIFTGAVVEVGPECKWLQVGDAVMWPKPAEIVIPFYDFGLKLINETRVLCVINEGLTQRFEKKNNG